MAHGNNEHTLEEKELKFKQDSKKSIIVSVDVECVANGPGHFDRTPCRIAAVDGNLTSLMDKIIFVDEKDIIDDFSAIHGLTAKDLKVGISLKEGLNILHDILIKLNEKNNVILVGCGIENDINWCQLKPNIHFNKFVDITQAFAGKNTIKYSSLEKMVLVLYNTRMSKIHNPTIDAAYSVSIYKDYIESKTESEIEKIGSRIFEIRIQFDLYGIYTVNSKYEPTKTCNYPFDPFKCKCGQKTKSITSLDGINIEQTKYPQCWCCREYKYKKSEFSKNQQAKTNPICKTCNKSKLKEKLASIQQAGGNFCVTCRNCKSKDEFTKANRHSDNGRCSNCIEKTGGFDKDDDCDNGDDYW